MAKNIDMAAYNELVASGKPFVIDFWAEWCGPCRALGPVIEELAAEYEGKVVIGKCDVDQNNDLAIKFGVRNIPLVVFVKAGGEMQDKLVGASPKDAIKAKIDALL
ncbi:MAG TPA: thioredoxin [Candidatus Tidjanibacter faecipullorum]|uniref:Thioredoxin n=1 Tax=Candidatus Tidjanibacter faecipullorum TaxID=2838766 RepID=A0A9D2DFD1_9BACT|nr:thioredoxin [Candidatus Tidjanibacter faecipullorum]